MIAPARGDRPGAPAAMLTDGDPDPQPCPFCEGAEALTPPETYADRDGGLPADGPGWRVRVVPNRYPAFSGELGRQEVVVHTPRHVRSLAGLAPADLHAVSRAWTARASAAAAAGFDYVHAFGNEGRAAGASLPHTHSQLLCLTSPPPAVTREESHRSRSCAICTAISASPDLVVDRHDGVVLLCPAASRVPFELLAAPESCEPDAFGSDRLTAALELVASAIRRLHRVVGSVALNWWVHTGRLSTPTGHWHVELVPRTTAAAGLEVGAELYVNPLAPERAAAVLRDAGPGPTGPDEIRPLHGP